MSRSLDKEKNRLKRLSGVLKEQESSSEHSVGAQHPSQNKKDPSSEKTQNSGDEDETFKDIMNSVINGFSDDLKKFANQYGNKDGDIDIDGEDQENVQEIQLDNQTQDQTQKQADPDSVIPDPSEPLDLSHLEGSSQSTGESGPGKAFSSDPGGGEAEGARSVDSPGEAYKDMDMSLDEQEEKDEFEYSSFLDFVRSEYGKKIAKEELLEAIKNWATKHMLGLYPADYETVAKYIDKKAYEDLKERVPNSYMNDLEKYLNFEKDSEELTLKEENLNEAIGAVAAGAAISAPSILQHMSKASKFLGKKLNSDTMKKVGDEVSEFAEKWHKKYIDVIKKMIKPYMKGYDEEKIDKAANAIFLSLVGTMAVASGHGAVSALEQGQSAVGGIESALASVKAGEISSSIESVIPKVLSQYFH